jgi:hypothetical protein
MISVRGLFPRYPAVKCVNMSVGTVVAAQQETGIAVLDTLGSHGYRNFPSPWEKRDDHLVLIYLFGKKQVPSDKASNTSARVWRGERLIEAK